MRCPEASETMSMHLDSALSAEEERALEGHLRECPECRRELELIQRVDGLLRDAQLRQPAPHFVSRVMVRVERDRQRAMWVRGALILLLGVVTGLALCLIPLLSPAPPVQGVVTRPSLVSSLVGVLMHLLAVLTTLFDALGALSQTLLGTSAFVGLLGVVGLATLLTVLWLTALTRASGRVYRQ